LQQLEGFPKRELKMEDIGTQSQQALVPGHIAELACIEMLEIQQDQRYISLSSSTS